MIVRPNLFQQNIPESTIPSIDASGTFYADTGPQALSYADAAAKLTTAMGRPISHVAVPDEPVREALLGFGLSPWFADALIGLYQDYRRSGTDGYAAQVTDTVQRLTAVRRGRWTACSARSRLASPVPDRRLQLDETAVS